MRSRFRFRTSAISWIGSAAVVCTKLALPASADNCRTDALAASGDRLVGASYELSYSLGLSFIESSASSSFQQSAGFWTIAALPNGPFPFVQYVTQGAARNDGPTSFEVVGLLGDCMPAVTLRSGALSIAATSVVALTPTRSQLQFDLADVLTGPWDLTFASSGGSNTLSNALVVYSEPIDLFRSTVSQDHDFMPAISRAGATLGSVAFISNRDGLLKLYVKSADSLDVVPLTPLLGSVLVGAGNPAWSKDGSTLACALGGNLLTLDALAPSDTVRVTNAGTDDRPAWSPVENRIAFTRLNANNDREICVVKSNGDSLVHVTAPAPGFTDDSVDWSPDGKRLVFSRQETGATPSSAIFTVSRIGGEPAGLDTLSSASAFTNTEPAWSPDGRWIAFASDRDGDFDIFVMDSRGEAFGLLQITTEASADRRPSWNSDGSKLAFASDRSGNFDVFIASNLPTQSDTDDDLVVDALDQCPGLTPSPGEIDAAFDGCPDSTSTLRAIRFWSHDRFPIVYETADSLDPRIPGDGDFLAIRAGFQTWASVESTTVSFVEGVRGEGLSIAISGDGRNSISFSDPRAAIDGLIAVTFVTSAAADTFIEGRWYAPGEIVDADVLFNKDSYSFSTDGGSETFDLQSVATHEAGHVFGFSHTAVQSPTMFYVIPQDWTFRSLHADDQALAARIYREEPSVPKLSIEGRVLRHTLTPVKAAGVIAVSADNCDSLQVAPCDTLQMTFTDVNGLYRFYDLKENFRVRAFPLDGGPEVGLLQPENVNALVDSLVSTEEPFAAEYWDEATESATDSGTGFVVSLASPLRRDADVILNVDPHAPSAVIVTPSPPDTSNVPSTTLFVARFSERIDLESVSPLTVRLVTNTESLSGVAALVNRDSVLVFRPDSLLEFSTEYTFTVGPGILDLFGNAMTDSVSVSFNTQQQPSVTVTALSPAEVPVGGILTISGSGFDPDASMTTVVFESPADTVSTNPFAATLDRLSLIVPQGAASGSLFVDVGGIEESDRIPVTILPPRVLPSGNQTDVMTLPAVPSEVVFSSAETRVWVATASGLSSVDVNEETGTLGNPVTREIPDGCTGIAASPDGRVLAVGPAQPRLRIFDQGTEVDSTDLEDSPLGIAFVPGSSEVLIVYAERVVLHDARVGSTFGSEVRVWNLSADTFLGDIAVGPSAREAFASTGNGEIAVLGLAIGEELVQVLPGGTEPRETAVFPNGSRFLGVDQSGNVRMNQVRGSLLQTLSLGGGFRGIVISPEGDFAYAANFIFNRVQILDLRGNNLIDGGLFATGIDPRDVTMGGRGRFAYVVTSAPPRLEMYETIAGPKIASVSPQSGGPGALLTIAGSGFNPASVDSNMVSIGGRPHVPVRVDSQGTTLVVRQLPDAESGTIVVQSFGKSSNSHVFAKVDRPDPGIFELGSRFVSGGTAPASLAMSPAGTALFALHDDGALALLAAARASDASLPLPPSRLHRTLAILDSTETHLAGAAKITVTADSRKLYAIDGEEVASFSFNAIDSAIARVGEVRDASNSVLKPIDLATTPDGRRLIISSRDDGTVYVADTASDLITLHISSPASPGAVVVHPLGTRAYLADGTNVVVLDIDGDSPSYGSTDTTLSVAGVPDAVRLLAAPDGRVLAWSPLPASSDYGVSVIDSDSTGHHTVVGPLLLTSGANPPELSVNRSGTLLFVADPNSARQKVYTLGSGLPSLIPGVETNDPALSGVSAMAISLDDARLYTTGSGDSILVTNLTPASGIAFQSGTRQIVAQGSQAAAPIVARVQGSPQELVEGSLVTFEVDPARGDFGFPDAKLFAAASSSGLIEGRFQAASSAVPGEITITLRLGDLAFPTTMTIADTLGPPRIVAIQPSSVELLSVNTSVGADFSKQVNPATITPSSFRVRPASGTIPVPGEFSFALGGSRVCFTPANPLEHATAYWFEVSVADTIRDLSGNAVSNPTSVLFATPAEPSSVTLHAISPQAGAAGAIVTLIGEGFSDLAAENSVYFGPVRASVIEADPGSLCARLPAEAPPGTLPVMAVVDGDTSNALDFEVLPVPGPVFTPTDSVSVSVPVSGQEIAVIPGLVRRAYITSAGANAVLPFRYHPQIVIENPIPVGLHPYGIAAAREKHRAYVTNFFSNDISVIDTDPSSPSFQSVVESIPAGVHPTGIAVHPNERSLYVANYGDATLTIIDTDSTHATHHLARATANTGTDTRTIVITPDGGLVIMGTSTGLVLLGPVKGEIRKTIDLGASTQSLAVRPAGSFVIVLTTDGRLLLVDVRPGQEGFVRATANTGSDGRSIVITPDGGFILVSSPEGLVRVFKLRIRGGAGASADPSAAQYELVTAGILTAGENPFGMAFDPIDPLQLFVVNEGSQTVSIFTVAGATSAEETLVLPASFQLYPNFPNPFDLRTTIRYDLPRASDVEVRIYDVAGRLVSVLTSRGEAAGRRTMFWDGRNSSGLQVASGIYFYEFRAGDFRDVRRMVRLR